MSFYDKMVRELVFDPDGGLVFRCLKKGLKRAGTLSKERGYRTIYIDGALYKEHRLMWLYVYGKWPDQIDHVNGKKDDNRIINLRETDHSGNQCNRFVQANNTSGYKGVNFHLRWKKWQARIGYGKKRVHLGYFQTKEEVYAAYCAAAPKYHGEFARVA